MGPSWQDSRFEDDGDAEWLTRQFVQASHLPLRWYLEVGQLERTEDPVMNQLTVNRHLRDVLVAKSYDVHYTEYNGGHTCLCWRGSLANGLISLIGSKKEF